MSQHQETVDDGLTDEERAALAITEDREETDTETTDDEGADVNQSEQQADTEGQPADQADAGDADADADADDGAGDAQPADAAEPAAEAQVEPAPAEEPRATSAPILIAEAPEDAQAKLAELEKKMETLAVQLDDGEITGAQFQVELAKANREHMDLRLQVERAEMAQQMEKQRLQNAWQADCTAFLKQHPEYEDADRLKLLDETLRALATMPSNQGLANDKALAKAHRMVKMELGEPVDAPATQTAQAKPAKQAAVPKPAAQPNIGNLPAAAMNDTTGGEFAALERLRKSGKVEEYEAAVDALSDAQRARYMREQ